jgi:VWFA-related protein
MNRSTGIAALALATSFVLTARAQQPPAPAAQPPQPPPVFRAGTDVVQVDVVVHDKQGNFVPGLKPEDFEIREEGQPEKIEQFYVVDSGAPAAAPAAATPAAPNRGAPATPAVEFPHTPRLFVVVFDDQHLSPGGLKRVRDAAISLFEKQFQKGDIGGVVAGGRMANNRLTSDRDELVKAVRDAKPNARTMSRLIDEREWPRMTMPEAVEIRVRQDQQLLREVTIRACNDDPDACKRADPTPNIMEKAQRMTDAATEETNQTLQVLAALMNGLGRFQGRKSLLLLTEGFIADESWPLVQQSVGLAARSNVTVYTLDARGLDRTGMSDRLTTTATDPGALTSMGDLLAQFDENADAMNSLAVDTGGFVVRNTNVFDRAVARIADDSSRYYVLGYHPQKAPDGKFRKISVKVNHPGVTVRARKGYVAVARPAVTTDAGEAGGAGKAGRAGGAREAAVAAAPGPVAASPENPSVTPGTAAPASPALSASPSLPASPVPAAAAPAAGVVVPNAAPAGGSTMHLRPDASKHVEDLAKSAPDPEAEKGWSAYQRGDLESASVSLAAAAAKPNARPWVHYALGQSEYALGHYDRAVAEWETVREVVPEFQPVYFDLVDGYIQLRDPDKAIRALRDAAKRWPKDADVYEAMGVVQTTRGALDDAIESFHKAVGLAPKDAVGYFNLAKALELRYVRTRRFVQQTHTWMGNKSDLESAITNYQRYLEIGGPLDNSAREGLARLNWSVDK